MVLAGFIVALGSVVDDAIIDVENVVRRLRQQRQSGESGDKRSTARVILDASLEVRPAIWHATLIIVLAVLPVFFMGGLSGRLLRAARRSPSCSRCWRRCWWR
jgi:Cu/Ag efflux pump CusA